jgi:hypothetical protein
MVLTILSLAKVYPPLEHLYCLQTSLFNVSPRRLSSPSTASSLSSVRNHSLATQLDRRKRLHPTLLHQPPSCLTAVSLSILIQNMPTGSSLTTHPRWHTDTLSQSTMPALCALRRS